MGPVTSLVLPPFEAGASNCFNIRSPSEVLSDNPGLFFICHCVYRLRPPSIVHVSTHSTISTSLNALKPYSPLIHLSNTTHGKIRILIELKSLREVVDKRRHESAGCSHSTMLPLNRLDFRRTRKPTIRDAHMTEQLERKQRPKRERRSKHKHVEQLRVICSHGRGFMVANRVAQDKVLRLGRAVLDSSASMLILVRKKKNRSVLRGWLRSV
jgi:hypothetical protein